VDDDVRIRRAVADDASFLVEAICEAEKAGTDRLSYCRIFDLDEEDFRRRLNGMLLEDLTGQELCISDFLVAEIEGDLVGACCGWVEGANGSPSTILKANLLLFGIEAQRIRAAKERFGWLAQLSIEREPGAIEIESVYVRTRGRGRGIAGRLIEWHLLELRSSATAGKAQVILTTTNEMARHAYEKAGFRPIAERHSTDVRLLELVPSLGKLLMERPLMGDASVNGHG
jgi:ribosomal protein S18 acetylase RimI-like enzyme